MGHHGAGEIHVNPSADAGFYGKAGGIYGQVVEAQRAHVHELTRRLAALERREVEAWFKCFAFTHADADPADLAQAHEERDAMQHALATARAEAVVAERRLARYEAALQSLTPQ